MRQGEIQQGQAWFGFTLDQLYWLLDYLPRTDGFHDQVRNAIHDLESEQPTPSN